MEKLKTLLLTEGMHGMISQAEGMAKALNTEFDHKIVRLNFLWNFVPPRLTPISETILKDKNYLIGDKIPDLIISCGRKSVIPSILLKRRNKKIFSIHIQDPKVNLKNFDAIIAPEHDNLKGDNVISSKGAIHYITQSGIEKAKPYLINKVKSQKIVSLILGGPNKYYSFSNEELTGIFKKIKTGFISDGYNAIIIPSLRTPKRIIDLAINEFDSNNFVVNSLDKQAYLSALALSTCIVVTCDSTSMISEAAASGKPIFVAHMGSKKNNYRFKKFFQLFKEMGITRELGESVQNWTYSKLNEVERIAAIINNKLNN